MRQQGKEELSFEYESMMCNSEDNSEVIDTTDDFQSGVRYVYIVHMDK